MGKDGNRALILDFGGVISRTFFETHDQSERTMGLPPGTLTWRGPFDPDSDPLWQAMQRDEISERDYWLTRTREVGALLGERWNEMADMVRRARGDDPAAVIRPEAEDAIERAAAAGIRLAILSNELDLFYGADFRQKLPLLDRFEVIVDATYTGILKPEPRAYTLCLEALKLPPEACVFVDDQTRNVAGARRAGLTAVAFDVLNPQDSFDRALAAFKPARDAQGSTQDA